jgi:hypothetical protein
LASRGDNAFTLPIAFGIYQNGSEIRINDRFLNEFLSFEAKLPEE